MIQFGNGPPAQLALPEFGVQFRDGLVDPAFRAEISSFARPEEIASADRLG